MAASVATASPPDFTREVRPILSDKCFACHGPADQESDLRLDTHAGATEWAVVPGSADQSEVIARVTLADDDESRMPPAHSGQERLTNAEVETLRRWINSGAEYEEHWAFTPVQRPAAPNGLASGHEIDAFLLERLEAEGFAFREEADRATLLRRVALDLTGLPPSAEDAKTFLSDHSSGAYERLVDRLLDSPRYGEHMARYWLDAVRYGDTHGKHLDNYREIWPYRDWVIRSLNDNKPYDEFLVEQLAGDLLDGAGQSELVASGFNRCNVTTAEGGVIEQEIYVDNVRDRTDAFGTVVLGLTVGCAKCHDHKYDPITQRDYYSLFAFFNSLDGGPNDGNLPDHAPAIRVPQPEQRDRLTEIEAESSSLRKELERDDAEVDAAQQKWEATLANLADPQVAATILSDPVVRASEWQWVGPFPNINRALAHHKTPAETSDFDANQQFTLRDGRVITWEPRPDWTDGSTHYALPGRTGANVLRRTLTAETEVEIQAALGSDDTARVYLNREVVHESKSPRGVTPGEDRFALKLKAGENELLLSIGNFNGPSGFHLEFTGGAAVLPGAAMGLIAIPETERTDEQRLMLRRLFRARTQAFPKLKELRSRLAAVETEWARVDREVPTTLVYRERNEPRDAFILNRGEYDNEGEKVDRATPGFLPALPDDARRDRLGLARWATSPTNPLTARVAVNRLWQQLFGVGLVKTADDFGSQAEPPSHPELLDWLAAEFVESGWDVKAMMRRLVTTRAYRQSSAAPSEVWAGDPENRLLARGPRFRLDGETLRDQALAVSGLLVNRLGGPPVKPPQPDGLWHAVAYSASNTAKFVADKQPDKVHRRSLYTFHKRTSAPPQMLIFDGPTRESCTVRRERTNTPLQALLLMNDPQFVEAAKALAARVLTESPENDPARAARLIELATARPATEAETDEIVSGVAAERERYRADAEAASSLTQVGVEPTGDGVDRAELAAWTMMANLVLNLDEVVTKN